MKSAFKLFGAAMLLAGSFMFHSCDLDGGENTQTYTVATCNLIIPDDEDAEVTAQRNCAYSIVYDFGDATVALTSTNVEFNGASCNMTSSPMPFTWSGNGAVNTYYFSNGDGTLSGGGSTREISNLSGFTTNSTFFYISDYDPFPVNEDVLIPVFQYRVGNAWIKTFQQNTCFSGVTTTSYQMGTETTEFENDKPIYRVYFANDFKTANVVIYHVQFAESMNVTLEAVVLKSLPVELNHSGYKISAEDVVPEMLSGTVFVPYEDKIFNSFELETVNSSLTKVKCSYTCAGTFHGEFEGQSVAEYISL